LAGPWPLKIIIDNVVGSHKMSPWLDHLVRPMLDGSGKLQVAGLAALAFVVIALLGAIATYIDNYYTESVGQWVANDLRMRTYHHLQRLSLGYYDTHQTGNLLSTMTTDIQTIQGFASSSTLNILVDLLTIVAMLGLMFWLNWDFTMIAVGVTPFLLFFVSRFKKAVKKATHQVRKEQSEIVAVVQQGLESMRVVKAFGRPIVGSINLAPGSFDSRRELAIEVHDDEIIDRLHKISRQDWENSHPLDLTDEGLLAELEDKDEHVAEDLAINAAKNSGK
jgi:subfamily B ATP-binding cassette protein MsbA